jgi:hypothetical protein
MEHLDGDLASEHGVVCPEDLTHPTGGDPFHHVVTAVEGDEGVPSAVQGRLLRDTSGDSALLPREALEGRSERVRRIVTPEGDPTVEAGETPSGGLGAELDRVEIAVDEGDTELGRLGFWRLVALIKRDDELIDRYAEQVGRIDAKAFRARVRFRAPIGVAVALQLLGIGVAVGLVAFAVWNANVSGRALDVQLASGVGLLVAAFALAAGTHTFAHLIVGRSVGIRFTDFFFAIPPPPLPGLKTDYGTYLRTGPVARAWMHASGAIVTKLAPFVVLAFAPAADAPGWSVAVLVALGIFQIVTDVLFSTKRSDWKKVRRELGVARERERARARAA